VQVFLFQFLLLEKQLVEAANKKGILRRRLGIRKEILNRRLAWKLL
jgi:hypothetical protein